ncbi:hypothetical protein [Zeimonas sediminis]|uniref:hypothetical protein n=1 Tax=Zeimonas sediminis TaxID=2944268 RepID=UPI002342D083|nr:hypothetical protein [Zeimonas sediminis]
MNAIRIGGLAALGLSLLLAGCVTPATTAVYYEEGHPAAGPVYVEPYPLAPAWVDPYYVPRHPPPVYLPPPAYLPPPVIVTPPPVYVAPPVYTRPPSYRPPPNHRPPPGLRPPPNGRPPPVAQPPSHRPPPGRPAPRPRGPMPWETGPETGERSGS